jgi:hypothetical protein
MIKQNTLEVLARAQENNQAVTVYPDGYMCITDLSAEEERARDREGDRQFMFGMKGGRD